MFFHVLSCSFIVFHFLSCSFIVFHFLSLSFIFFYFPTFSFIFLYVPSFSDMFFHFLSFSLSLLGAQHLIFFLCLNFVKISLKNSYVKNQFLGPSRVVE